LIVEKHVQNLPVELKFDQASAPLSYTIFYHHCSSYLGTATSPYSINPAG